MPVSRAHTVNADHGLRMDSTSEKRKVGGSTPPLTTLRTSRKSRLTWANRSEAALSFSGCSRLTAAGCAQYVEDARSHNHRQSPDQPLWVARPAVSGGRALAQRAAAACRH